MARPRKYNISLTDDEVKKLKSIMHKKQTSKTVRNRCQILLDLDDAHMAKSLPMNSLPKQTVYVWLLL